MKNLGVGTVVLQPTILKLESVLPSDRESRPLLAEIAVVPLDSQSVQTEGIAGFGNLRVLQRPPPSRKYSSIDRQRGDTETLWLLGRPGHRSDSAGGGVVLHELVDPCLA